MAYTSRAQYLFGEALLVAPIVAPIAPGSSTVTATAWLPPGTWLSWNGALSYSSPATTGLSVNASYRIDEVPIFVRAGAVVPLRTMASLKQTVAFSDPLVWVVWPAADVPNGNATVLEDDGATLLFEQGAIAKTTMHWAWIANGKGISKSRLAAGTVRRAVAIILTVEPTSGTFNVGCQAEVGFEYTGADLQDMGVTASAGACCDVCGSFTNCAFWTYNTDNAHCALKVSRRGRHVNNSAVSGVAARIMPSSRAHVFQLRFPSPQQGQGPSTVNVNGVPLTRISPASQAAGWFVQPAAKDCSTSLITAEGSVVVQTERIPVASAVTVVIHW